MNDIEQQFALVAGRNQAARHWKPRSSSDPLFAQQQAEMIPFHCNDGYLLYVDGKLIAGVEGWTFTEADDYRATVNERCPAWKHFCVERYFRLDGEVRTRLVCGSVR